ncbi:hypothetical protein MSPP1_001719 [Malassezia sp. CBS 17886]|nr:hypothetical protein MSPP1_001719 [Malassezia sp. CBS 17886]
MAAAPLLQTPIQLSVHSPPQARTHTHSLCTSNHADQTRSHVAVGDVVRTGAHMRRRRGLVATVEQGVAVVLLDLQTQTPVHTYTLAPSDRVCTPPLVVERGVAPTPGARRELLRTTYFGVRAGGDDTSLWARTEVVDASGRRVADAETRTREFHVPGVLDALLAVPDGSVLAVRDDGDVLLLADPIMRDASVVARVSGGGEPRFHTLVLDADGARTLLRGVANDTPLAAYAITSATPRGSSRAMRSALCVRVIAVYADALRVYGGEVLEDKINASQVITCALATTGRLAVLGCDGELLTAQLTFVPSDTEAHECHCIRVAPALHSSRHGARVLFLSPSHLLMVAVPRAERGKERAAALVWDVDFDAVLAHVEWSLPAFPTRGRGGVAVSATRATDDYVLVQLDPASADAAWRCSVAALPVGVPETGLLRHALGTAARTAPWLAGAAVPTAPLPAAPAALVDTLARLPRDDRAAFAAAVDQHFLAYIAAETERLRAADARKSSRKAPKLALDNALVRALLDAALPAAKSRDTHAPCARDTLRYLLERGAVSAAMMPRAGGSLVARMRLANDWSLLNLVLRHVPDLVEADAAAILRDALASRNADEAPPVARVLQHVLAPPAFSKPVLRVALRHTITREDDVVVLMDILRRWLNEALNAPVQGDGDETGDSLRGTSADAARRSSGMLTVPRTGVTYRAGAVHPPPVDATVSFFEDLLDTYFPQLLAAPAYHAFLADTTRALSVQVQALQTLGRLRGPLGAFARASKRKDAPRADKSKRLTLHEASLLVPAYSFETLDV